MRFSNGNRSGRRYQTDEDWSIEYLGLMRVCHAKGCFIPIHLLTYCHFRCQAISITSISFTFMDPTMTHAHASSHHLIGLLAVPTFVFIPLHLGHSITKPSACKGHPTDSQSSRHKMHFLFVYFIKMLLCCMHPLSYLSCHSYLVQLLIYSKSKGLCMFKFKFKFKIIYIIMGGGGMS